MNWQESPVFHFAGLRDYFGFVALGDVVSMPREIRPQIAMIEVVLGAQRMWHTGIAQADSLQYEAPTTTNEQGSSYNHRLTGFYPITTPEASRMLAAMIGKRYVVIFQDRNGCWRIIGNINRLGARFYSSLKIETFEGVAGYSFEFSLQSRYPAAQLLYTPVQNAQVYAYANGYTFVDVSGAMALYNELVALPA